MDTIKYAATCPIVLCVDEEPERLCTMSQALSRFGCKVILADNGSQATMLLEQMLQHGKE